MSSAFLAFCLITQHFRFIINDNKLLIRAMEMDINLWLTAHSCPSYRKAKQLRLSNDKIHIRDLEWNCIFFICSLLFALVLITHQHLSKIDRKKAMAVLCNYKGFCQKHTEPLFSLTNRTVLESKSKQNSSLSTPFHSSPFAFVALLTTCLYIYTNTYGAAMAGWR